MPLNAQILLSILAHETSAGDLSRTLRATPANYALTLTDGTGANQAQVVWSDTRTVGAQDEDIIGGVGFAISDDRGIVSFSSIKIIYIKNTGTGEIRWSGNDWPNGPILGQGPSGLKIKSGGVLITSAPDASGWPTAGSSFVVVNDTNASQTYEIVLIGEGSIA